jgi:hypothetical protein
MVHTFPPNAGGFGGRGRIATMEDINAYREFNKNNYLGGTFNNEAAVYTMTTNHNKNINNQNNNKNTKRKNHPHRRAPCLSSLSHGSRWAESCCKPLINVPHKRTFGAPDQGQMLDV